MTIEIHQPELEAMIQERMASGRFRNVEEVLIAALKAVPEEEIPKPRKKNFTQFLRDSPLWGSNIGFERPKDDPQPIEL